MKTTSLQFFCRIKSLLRFARSTTTSNEKLKKKKTMAKMLHSKCKNAAAKSIFGWNFESAINANRTLG